MSIDVGAVHDFPDERISVVSVGRSEVGIVKWHGRIHAISTVCTHQGGPLCRGVLAARLSGANPGDMTLEDAAPVIACPWHGWEFDVATGQAIWDARLRIRTFPVEIIGDRVFVETSAAAGA